MPKKALTNPQNVAATSAPKKSESSTEPVNQVVESVTPKGECEVLLSDSTDEKPEVDMLGKQFEGVLHLVHLDNLLLLFNHKFAFLRSKFAKK